MCCNLEFLVWKMSSKGKPREGVTSMEPAVVLSSNALDGGFNSSWSSQERGSRKDLSEEANSCGFEELSRGRENSRVHAEKTQ